MIQRELKKTTKSSSLLNAQDLFRSEKEFLNMISYRLIILLTLTLLFILCQSAHMPRLATENLYVKDAAESIYSIHLDKDPISKRIDIRDLAEELFGPAYLENNQFYVEDDNDFLPRESFIESFFMKASEEGIKDQAGL